MEPYTPEEVEFGVRRENLYVREREALEEMEDVENGESRSSSYTAGRKYPV